MVTKHYVAVDLGAESGRVMLGELSEGGLKLTELHRFPNLQIRVPHKRGETLHWDILRLWHEIKVGLAKAAELGVEIAGVGVDVWGVDFGLLDENGALVANPVCYRDPRTNGMVDAVFAKLSKDKIYSITGIQTMSLNTLFQLASLSFGNSPQLRAAKSILFLPDLLTYWLCGAMATEYTIASTSQMLDARTRLWSSEVFGAIGVDPALFPPIDVPGRKTSVRGAVLASANEKLAGKKVPVIAVGSHDTASAVVAVPADAGKGDWLYLSSGTWSLLGAEVDQPVLTPKAAEYNITNEGGVGGKIRLLKNIAGLYLLQECRREWARQGTEYDYGTLTGMAEKAGPQGVLLDLEDPAFSTPGDMPNKINGQLDRRKLPALAADAGVFTRVILESLAASYAKVRGMLEEVTGKRFTALHIVGGGSQNHLLNQLAANATGLPVFAGPVEATAMGNVLTQAISTGGIASLAEARALVGRSAGIKRFEPRG